MDKKEAMRDIEEKLWDIADRFDMRRSTFLLAVLSGDAERLRDAGMDETDIQSAHDLTDTMNVLAFGEKDDLS